MLFIAHTQRDARHTKPHTQTYECGNNWAQNQSQRQYMKSSPAIAINYYEEPRPNCLPLVHLPTYCHSYLLLLKVQSKYTYIHMYVCICIYVFVYLYVLGHLCLV